MESPQRSAGANPPPNAMLRIGGALCCLWIFWAAKTIWIIGRETRGELVLVLSLLVFALFFILAFETFAARLPERYTAHVIAGIVVALIVYGYGFANVLHVGAWTDELFFSVAATKELLAGHNPYGVDLTSYVPPAQRNKVPSDFFTQTESGSAVSTVPYPALSVLAYIPATLLHFSPAWIGYAAFICSLLVLVALAPAASKTLAPLAFFINPASLEFVGTGVEDILFVAPLLLAAFFWTEMPVLAGTLLGVACAVKQVPWLEIPFFAIGLFAVASGRLGQRLRPLLGSLAAVAVAFAVFNVPFIITKPASWFAGVTQTFTSKYVESGIGLVSLNLYAADVNIPRWVLTALAGTIFVAFIVVGYLFFPKLRNALWLAPGVALFVAPRSLENYFIYLIPLAVASWFGQQPEALELKGRLIARWRATRFGRLMAA